MLNKLLTKLQQKYSKNSLFQKDGFLAPADEKDMPQNIKLPLFRLMFSPFIQILDYPKVFFSLSLSAAMLLSLSSTFLGFNYLCSYPEHNMELYCSNSFLGYIAHVLFKMFVLSYVGIKWYEYVNDKSQMSIKSLRMIDKRYLKLSGYLFLFLILNMLPLVSWWFLYIREPNPDWQIEMVFFAFVSIGFIVPLILLRFYTSLIFIIKGERPAPISIMWQKTKGNTVRIFLSFMLIMIVAMFIFGNIYTNFRILSNQTNLYNVLSTEYIYEIFSILMFICIINNISFQYEKLYISIQDKKDE